MFSLVLVGGATGLLWALPLPTYDDVPAAEVTVEASAERIERGRQLVADACAVCHSSAEDPHLTGRVLREAPDDWGTIVAPNLTGHRDSGIMDVSDGALIRALRTGIGSDGRFLVPYMPRYPRMSDEDLASIIAFLRSDDPWVLAAAVEPKGSAPSLWAKARSRLTWRPRELPAGPISAPPAGDALALGAYLVEDVLQCNLCHGSTVEMIALERPTEDEDFLSGGIAMTDHNGEPLYGANLTFDAVSGIGEWTLDEFIAAMRDGVRPDGTRLRWPMRRYLGLGDDELAAIYAYLSNVPHVARDVPARSVYPLPGHRLDRGPHLFVKHECFSCHGDKTPHGILRAAVEHFATDEAVAEFLRDPSAVRPGTQMPAYDEVIDDADRVALGAYVRSMATARHHDD